MWRVIADQPPVNHQDCLVSDGKSLPVCAVAMVFDRVTWSYLRPKEVEAGYSPKWWMPMPRLPQRSDST